MLSSPPCLTLCFISPVFAFLCISPLWKDCDCTLMFWKDGAGYFSGRQRRQTGKCGMSRLVIYPGQHEGPRCQRTWLWLLGLHVFLEGGTSFCLLLTSGKWSVLSGVKTSLDLHSAVLGKSPASIPILEDLALSGRQRRLGEYLPGHLVWVSFTYFALRFFIPGMFSVMGFVVSVRIPPGCLTASQSS